MLWGNKRQISFLKIGSLSALALCALFLMSCSSIAPRPGAKHLISGESIVLAGEQPSHLAFAPVRSSSVQVRNTYRNKRGKTVRYEAGRDYVLDAEHGQIRRTPNSRIPDFQTNMLFGVEDFDHSKYPGFGNGNFIVFVDYLPKHKANWLTQPSQVEFLPKTKKKLQHSQPLKIVAFGDSITAGGDATEPSLIFWNRWANWLQQKYPRAKVEAINGATGGDTTRNGLDRLQEKVLNAKPDLVLIGFGMNDHNIGGYGVSLDNFSQNLVTMIDHIRQQTSAEIVLYSTFPPNPKWHFGSHNMEAYAHATQQVAEEKRCAYADVYHNWNTFAANKKPEDLLGNNINHPNDFGHSLYFEVLKRLGL